MSIRVALSKLATAEARHTAARLLLMGCVLGYVVTLSMMFASGAGLRRWFFALLVWSLFIYVPLRILLEAFQAIAPGMRQRLITETARRPNRYGTRPSVELIVDGLFDRSVVMPRIAKPIHGLKVREGAVAVLLQIPSGENGWMRDVVAQCLGTVERWVTDIANWSGREASTNIQARWADLRALAALAAMTKVLIAGYRDRSGLPWDAGEVDDEAVDAYLDACLDYCDQLALEVDVIPWTEPSLKLSVQPEKSHQTRLAWKAFCETPSPALEARQAFVNSLTRDSLDSLIGT